MKFKFIIFILLTSIVAIFADSVKLAWDANSETDLAGYRVHYGTVSRNYTNIIDVGNVTTFIVTNLTYKVTYYFAVTAYNTSGLESEYSNEVSWNSAGHIRVWGGARGPITNKFFPATNNFLPKSNRFFTNRVFNP